MILSTELNYQLDYLKKELEKKEHGEFQNFVKLIDEIQSGDAKLLAEALKNLAETCKQNPKNYVALSLYAFCIMNNMAFKYWRREAVLEFLKNALAIKEDFIFANHLLGFLLGELRMSPICHWYRENEPEAIKLLSVAANAGYAPAYYDLAYVQFGEDCLTSECDYVRLKNPEKLRALVTKSALAGYPKAQFEYFRGIIEGCTEDTKQRMEFLESLAVKGHKEAQYELGKCYDTGIGMTANKEQAIFWYQSCERNNFQDGFYLEIAACFKLARLFDDHQNAQYKDLNEAILAHDYYSKTICLGEKVFDERNKRGNVFVSRGGPVNGGSHFLLKECNLSEMLKICQARLPQLNTILYEPTKKECLWLNQYDSSRVNGLLSKDITNEILSFLYEKPRRGRD